MRLCNWLVLPLWGVQGVQDWSWERVLLHLRRKTGTGCVCHRLHDGSWERLSLQRIHCGTGELCNGRGLQNATEDLLIRVSWSVH